MSKKSFALGGIHPAGHKFADTKLRLLELPRTAVLLLSQHIGAPATPVVAKGDSVQRGQLVAEHPTYVSAGIHTPITGTVAAIDNVILPNGKPSKAIIVKATDEQHAADSRARAAYWERLVPGCTDRELSETTDAETIRKRVADAGIVGMGGAAFPSHVKLAVKGPVPDLLIINACECEPYLMCDDALMRTFPARIVEGVELILKGTGIPKAVIAMEDNKPEAAAAIAAAIDGRHDITLQVLRTRYPQGGEKQLIQAVTGKRVPAGAIPAAIGVIVHNVATAFAVWQAVDGNMPLIERVVTITGDIPAEERCNYIAAVGTPLSEFPFTLPENARVIVGGPMMGRTAVCLDAPLTKGTSGLTILSEASRRPVQPCMRCGKCVDVCPMGLEPYLLATFGRLQRWDEARANAVADCIECGSCSYTCPSARPLLDYIRLAKERSRKR